MRTVLLPHNKAAYRKVMKAFETSDRTCIVHPTGTGKSYLIAAVSENFKRVLILAPSQFILQQQRKVMKGWPAGVDFATYSGLSQNVEAVAGSRVYDLIVLDEFHRAGAQEWGAAVNHLLELNAGAKVFGTSATPVRYLDGERDMADELFDRNIANQITIAEAWTKYKILPIPRYVRGLFQWDKTVNDTKERIERSRNLTAEEKRQRIFRLTNTRLHWELSYGMPTILRRHLDKDARRVIVFCGHIEGLEKMRQEVIGWFREAGFTIVSTCLMHSELPYREQREQMDRFEDDTDGKGVKLMFSVNMLNEGIHIPNVSAVIMLRTTDSRIIYMQQLGRCLTAANTEKPLVLDMVDNITTTTAIKDIADEFDRLEAVQAESECREPRKFEVVDYTLGVRELIKKLVPQIHFTVEENLALVKQFCEEHGRVPSQHKEQEMYMHWIMLKRKAPDNAEVQELIAKYGKQHITAEEAIAEIEEYHKRTGRFLTFSIRKGGEHSRMAGLWKRLRKHYPDHPTVKAWMKILQKQEDSKLSEALKKLTEMAESGKSFSRSKEYQMFRSNIYKDYPGFVAFRKKYCHHKPPRNIENDFTIMETFCKSTNRLPTLTADGEAYLAYNNLKAKVPDSQRLKELRTRYHHSTKKKAQAKEQLKAIEQFYCENGYLPTKRTPLGRYWVKLKKYYADDPDVQRIEQNCRYKGPRLKYILEDVRIFCEMHGELPTTKTNYALYKSWKNSRCSYPDNPEILALLKQYGKPENMPRRKKNH